jgi:oligopeptidase B
MKTSLRWVCATSLIWVACGIARPTTPQSTRPDRDPSTPPIARAIAHPVTQHGETRQDDYYWLRDKNDKALRYLKEENEHTKHVLAPTAALRERLFTEIKGRIRETDEDVPFFDRGYHYYSRTIEGAQYPIECRKRGSRSASSDGENKSAPEEVLLDLNAIAISQSFIAIGAFEVSDDGNLLAYSLDNNGFREYTLSIKDLRTGKELIEPILKTSSVAWAADNRTLFYTVEDAAKRPYRVYRRVLGEAKDTLVYEERDERFYVDVERSRSGELITFGSYSHTASEISFLRADAPAAPLTLVKPRAENLEYYVEQRGDTLFIRANDTGGNFRIVSAPLARPAEWTELQAHSSEVMVEGLDVFRHHRVALERVSGVPRFTVTVDGAAPFSIPVDEPVYELYVSDNRDFDAPFFRYEYTSLTTPTTVIDFDVKAKTHTVRKQIEVVGGHDPSAYQAERILARASDGTDIPISLVAKKGVPRDGSAPMWLTGYGAYGYPHSVGFSHARLSLLQRGVVYAIAHVRGGGELGKRWHDLGRMQHKMNTFTDFIAVAEHLIANKITRRDRLVIEGGSAGGLLVGAVTNMRPDLFGAVIADVPFVDVLNTMSDASLPLTVGEYEEWGNPAIAEQYAWMRAYCPYTNIGRHAYPAMLVKTAWHDSQVMYWEAAKYVAKLRRYKTDHNPLLLQASLGAGHGGASGRYDRWREVAFDYAFALWRMGLAK